MQPADTVSKRQYQSLLVSDMNNPDLDADV